MANVNGQYFLINKHKLQKGGRKLRRRFYTEAELDEARKMGTKYAVENREDYLIVQVISEVRFIPATNTTQHAGASTESGLYNCFVCGEEKCSAEEKIYLRGRRVYICEECGKEPTACRLCSGIGRCVIGDNERECPDCIGTGIRHFEVRRHCGHHAKNLHRDSEGVLRCGVCGQRR